MVGELLKKKKKAAEENVYLFVCYENMTSSRTGFFFCMLYRCRIGRTSLDNGILNVRQGDDEVQLTFPFFQFPKYLVCLIREPCNGKDRIELKNKRISFSVEVSA